MDITYLLRVLLRRKWTILLATLLAAGAAFVISLFKKPLYESVAQYSTGFTAEKVRLIDGSSVDYFNLDAKFKNVTETMKSIQVIGMLSYRLLLHDLENPNRAFRKLKPEQTKTKIYNAVDKEKAIEILKKKLQTREILYSSETDEKNILEFLELYKYDYKSLRDFLTISRVEGTDYMNIVCFSENAELSAFTVNTLGQEFLSYYRSLTEERSGNSAETIDQLVAQQQKKVDSLNEQLRLARVKTGAIDPTVIGTGALQTVTQLETKLAEERGKNNTYVQNLASYKTRLATLQQAAGAGNNNAEVVRLKNKQQELMAENNRKGGNDPDLQRQIQDITAQIVIKSSSGGNTTKRNQDIDDLNAKISTEQANLTASNETIQQYEDRIKVYDKKTNVNPGGEVELKTIQAKLDIENNALKNIKEKYSQAQGLLKENPAENFKQTLVGQPAIEPEPAKRIMTTALAAVSMMFLAMIIILFAEIFDSSVKTPSQFLKAVSLKLLSVVNNVNLKNKNILEVVGNTYLEGKTVSDEEVFKEHLRKLRFEIDSSSRKVFLFTSTKTGEGKSTIIEALATSLYLSKKKVLLIDTNFSNNTLTQKFEASPTLEDSIRLNNNFSLENFRRIISPTSIPGVDIIGCKGGNYTPAEILPFNNILSHLSNLDTEYDYIFLEGAALNNHSDSNELTQYVDKVVIVFSAESSIKQTDIESIRFLQNLNGKFSGAILNNVQTENMDL
ncbi:MAG: hypothetical protein C5B52_13255 [Bacteroidetes bacterium]|nr:MAG: hypothetical protein C5B52_13255 [Bacteroidota bacterium]